MAGAVPHLLYYRVYKKRWKEAWYDEQLKGLVLIGIVVSVLLTLTVVLQDGLGWTESFRHGMLVRPRFPV